jgi:hypothetical protein
MGKRFLVLIISFYREYLSPYLPSACRFNPTCSEFAQAAIVKYGLWRGLLKSLWRLLRCNPFTKGGYEPVR